MARLDVRCVELNLTRSRAVAQDAIKDSRVLVNGKVILKPAFEVNEEDEVVLLQAENEFVSRGGFKLKSAFEAFHVRALDKVVLDIGASTGGFSDYCLQDGARYVYAVDVGNMQLDDSLRQHPSLCSMENTNALDLSKQSFKHDIDLCVMDVSFVSIKALIPHLVSICDKAEFVVLIKPQFEAGKKDIGKKGIVKDSKVHVKVIQDTIQFLQYEGLAVEHVTYSATKGRDGNQEYFVHFKKGFNQKTFDVARIVKEAKS